MYEHGDGEGHDVGAWYPQPAGGRGRAPRWLVIGALALAFAIALGVGAALGSTIMQTAQASSLGQVGVSHELSLAATPGTQTRPGAPGAVGAPGQQGLCGTLTVSSVSGQTIVAKATDGTTVTIHTTASTQYTTGGQSATASAVTAGARIHVDGTHNSDGSITATRVDVG